MSESLPTAIGSSQFDEETRISPVGPGRWSTTIHPQWNINENPNGGYAMSPLLRAMAPDGADHPDPVSVTTHFLRPAMAGADAELEVDVLRRGRRLSTVRGSMIQDGKRRLEAIATFGDLSVPDLPDRRLDIAPPDLAPVEECVPRVALAQGVDLPLLSRVEVLVDPEPAPQGGGREATIAGWIRFADARPPDSAALVLFADCFPPSVFMMFGRTGWVPTIELTVHVRRRPVGPWIRAAFTTRELAGELLVEDGLLWDDTGRVVAQSRQLALIAA